MTKGAQTKARILSAAVEHFATLGLHAGSVPEIARAAGTSHASVYQHFGRKEELFRAAVEADLTALFDTVVPALDAATLDPDTLTGLLQTLLVEGRRRPLARRVIAEIDREQTEVLLDLPALRDLENRLASALAAAQSAGTIRADVEPAATAAGIVGIALPMLVVAFRLEGMPAIPRATSALELLAAALRPAPKTKKRNQS
jgi:AcrR family transcriptional regulator